jgi:hypothetical protein
MFTRQKQKVVKLYSFAILKYICLQFHHSYVFSENWNIGTLFVIYKAGRDPMPYNKHIYFNIANEFQTIKSSESKFT